MTALNVVQYETLIRRDWHPVARYETASGFVHLDLQTQTGKTKYRMPIQDLSEALTLGIEDSK